MIRYSLVCPHEHAFDSWFRDSAAFDALAGSRQVTCPACGDSGIRKAVMAPSVVSRRGRPKVDQPAQAGGPAPAVAPPAVAADDRARQVREAVRDLRRRIAATADDVGRAFAAEARAIHHGEVPERAIFGEATRDEVASLLEDGIPLLPIPSLPDDHH